MKHRSTLLILACAALSAIVWLVSRPNESVSVDEPLALRTAEPAAAVESPQASEREPVAQLEMPSGPAAVEGVAEATPPVVSDTEKAIALYSEKYRKATMAELIVARYDLDKRVASEVARISKEILDSGDLETTIVRPGESGPGISTKSGGPPVVSGVMTFGGAPLEDGSMISKHRVIEPEKYPEFHALEMEAWWLASEVRHRERLAK